MDIDKIKVFLRKNNFIESTKDDTFSKNVDGIKKRYIFKGKSLYMEVKRLSDDKYQLFAYGDIKNIYVSDTGKLSGMKRAIPDYTVEALSKGKNA